MPSAEDEAVEVVARVLEPQAWKAAGTAKDSLAYQNRRTSSLRKARTAIDAYVAFCKERYTEGSVDPDGEVTEPDRKTN